MNNAMREWLAAASREEAVQLAKRAKTSLGTLRQIAGGYRTKGKASTTPETAKAIEVAAEKLRREGLPVLGRGDLCQACGKCEYLNGEN